MKNKIPGHLVLSYEWKDWNDYENYIYIDEIRTERYDAYADTPSKQECDKLCAERSGEVIIYKIKKSLK